jgi:hypothetical protein
MTTEDEVPMDSLAMQKCVDRYVKCENWNAVLTFCETGYVLTPENLLVIEELNPELISQLAQIEMPKEVSPVRKPPTYSAIDICPKGQAFVMAVLCDNLDHAKKCLEENFSLRHLVLSSDLNSKVLADDFVNKRDDMVRHAMIATGKAMNIPNPHHALSITH